MGTNTEDEILEHPSKGKGVYKHEKLKPILDWVDAVIVSKGRLANHEAKAKYIELYGEFSSSKAWSSKSRRIRQLLALTSSEEVVLLGNGKKTPNILVAQMSSFLNFQQVFVNTTNLSFNFSTHKH